MTYLIYVTYKNIGDRGQIRIEDFEISWNLMFV